MSDFSNLMLPLNPTVQAPDGSDVRVLLTLSGGSMAHFHLAAGSVTRAVVHRTVEEIWYITSGRGQMWRKQHDREEVVDLVAGLCLTIPVGTHFQFRSDERVGVEAVAITMPPWPGADEAMFVTGCWLATEN